jgi:hypothetical protein
MLREASVSKQQQKNIYQMDIHVHEISSTKTYIVWFALK